MITSTVAGSLGSCARTFLFASLTSAALLSLFSHCQDQGGKAVSPWLNY